MCVCMCETNCSKTASVIASENTQRLSRCYVTTVIEWRLFLAFDLMDRSIVGGRVLTTFIAEEDKRRWQYVYPYHRDFIRGTECCCCCNLLPQTPSTNIGSVTCSLFLWGNMDVSSRNIRSGFESFQGWKFTSQRLWNILWIEHLLQQKRSNVWCFSASNKSYHGWQDIISEGVCLPDRLWKDKWTHEYHFLFTFSCLIILEKFLFKCLKPRVIRDKTAQPSVFLPLSLLILKFRHYTAYFCLPQKLFILQFLIWHKTMLNPRKFWTWNFKVYWLEMMVGFWRCWLTKGECDHLDLGESHRTCQEDLSSWYKCSWLYLNLKWYIKNIYVFIYY